MELASSSAPGASYFNFSVAQAVVTISVNVVLVWLSAVIKSSSSCSSSSRPSAATAPEPEPEHEPASAKDASDSEVDLDVVLGLMGASGPALVGFEEAAALFEEEEATVEEAAAAFRVFDRNGDGFIDAGELGSVLRSLGFAAGVAAADCQRMIDAYDGDKDGRMDFQEFLVFMERSSSS
ncbi:hypothetical protein ACQ4PT_048116 [Festuca glaucescens]